MIRICARLCSQRPRHIFGDGTHSPTREPSRAGPPASQVRTITLMATGRGRRGTATSHEGWQAAAVQRSRCRGRAAASRCGGGEPWLKRKPSPPRPNASPCVPERRHGCWASANGCSGLKPTPDAFPAFGSGGACCIRPTHSATSCVRNQGGRDETFRPVTTTRRQ